jgi:phytoene/squalene synthetase
MDHSTKNSTTQTRGSDPVELDFVRKPEFEAILTNPILDIAARFWDDDRYAAFRTCYRSMRVIDDLVDDRKAAGPLAVAEARQYEAMIRDWVDSIRRKQPSDGFQNELLAVMERFVIPTWPWERLARAMTFDLCHDGFPTFLAFRRYAEGAAVAPASIFMHLCGIRKEGDHYTAPPFVVAEAARPLALFSYLTHIIRDFQKDHQRQLNYFPASLLNQQRVTVEQLHAAASGGPVPQGLRAIVGQYLQWMDYYRAWSLRSLSGIKDELAPQYRLSLAIIFALYQQIVDRIDPHRGTFSAEELNPTPEEVRERLEQIIIQQQDNIHSE